MTKPLTRRRCLAMAAAIAAPPVLARAASTRPAAATLPLVELRQYRTHPGRRDDLIGLFEREFVESQEAVGMKIIGAFREPARPDNFTWLRGFTDMAARAKGLNDFYYGPVWQAHRNQANDTLDDNDDVLLLREASPGSGFQPARAPRAAVGAPPPAGHGVVVAVVAYPRDPAAFAAHFNTAVRPRLKASGGRLLATFVREHSANNFPRLPVREADEVFVWFEGFRDMAAWDKARAAFDRAAALGGETAKPADVRVLAPTARSELRG